MPTGVNYGTWDENQTLSWNGDYLGRDHLIPGGVKLDAAQFLPADAVVVDPGAAAQGATSIPVAALSGPIPNGTILDFGTDKFARLTAAAAAGATTLTVSALPTALTGAETATYAGAGVLKAHIPAGTAIGRTLVERDADTPYGPADAADAEGEIYLTAFDIEDVEENNDAVLYRPGSVVKENKLPNWANVASGVKTLIRARYRCVLGAD